MKRSATGGVILTDFAAVIAVCGNVDGAGEGEAVSVFFAVCELSFVVAGGCFTGGFIKNIW
jgi:hypothetical protein